MHIHIVDHNTLHLTLIKRMVKESLPTATITTARTHDSHEEHAHKADLVIISGGTWLVHKNPGTHKRLMSSLLEHGKPIFAICLGAEAVAHFFGGKLSELESRQQGIINISLKDKKIIENLNKEVLPVYVYHKWAIQSLPNHLKTLASSETGIEFFKHKKLPIWATQFHPEARRGGNKGYLLFTYALKEMDVTIGKKENLKLAKK